MSENTEVAVQSSPAVVRVPEATWVLFVVVVAAVVGTVYRFGYPALITFALIGAFTALTALVVLTALDAFGRKPSRKA
jgi:hypothetical protein